MSSDEAVHSSFRPRAWRWPLRREPLTDLTNEQPATGYPMSRPGQADMIRRILEDFLRLREMAGALASASAPLVNGDLLLKAKGLGEMESRLSGQGTVARQTGEYRVEPSEMLRPKYWLASEEIAGKLNLPLPRLRLGSNRAARGTWRPCSRRSDPPLSAPASWRAEPLGDQEFTHIQRAGHRIPDDRCNASAATGHDSYHMGVDDAARLAKFETAPGEHVARPSPFLCRPCAGSDSQVCRVERMMTDRASGYVAQLFRTALRILGTCHIGTWPFTAKTNGKGR